MKIQVVVFWVVTPCHVAVGYQRFGGPRYLTLKLDAARSSETLVSYHITTRRDNVEDDFRMLINEQISQKQST